MNEQEKAQLTGSFAQLKGQVQACSAMASGWGSTAKTPAIGPTGPVVVPALVALVPVLKAQTQCMESIQKILEKILDEV